MPYTGTVLGHGIWLQLYGSVHSVLKVGERQENSMNMAGIQGTPVRIFILAPARPVRVQVWN